MVLFFAPWYVNGRKERDSLAYLTWINPSPSASLIAGILIFPKIIDPYVVAPLRT